MSSTRIDEIKRSMTKKDLAEKLVVQHPDFQRLNPMEVEKMTQNYLAAKFFEVEKNPNAQVKPMPSTAPTIPSESSSPELPEETYGDTLENVTLDLHNRGFIFVQPDDIRFEASQLSDGFVVKVGTYDDDPGRAFVVLSGTSGQPPVAPKQKSLLSKLFGSS